METPEQIVEQLNALCASLPASDPRSAVPAGRRLTHVDASFIEAVIAALAASSLLQAAVGCTPDELRESIEDAARWAAAVAAAAALLERLQSAQLRRRHALGLAAMQTYKACEDLELAEQVARLKPLNRFGRTRRSGGDHDVRA